VGKALGLSNIWPGLFSPDKFGQTDSGRALRLRMMTTLWATMRKRRFYTSGIKRLVKVAQQLQAASRGRLGFEPAQPELVWGDVLPFDALEAAQVEVLEHGAQLSSRKRSVARLNPGANSEEVEKELEDIEDDISRSTPSFMIREAAGGGGGLRPPTPRLPRTL